MVESLRNALSAFLAYIPQLIGAIIILIVGYIIANVLQAVVSRALQTIGFDRWMERGGIKQFFDRADTREMPTSILGTLVFWFVFIIAIVMSTDALGIRQVSAVLSQLIAYIPNVIAAVLIIILANFVARLIRGVTGWTFWRPRRGSSSSSTRSSRPSCSCRSRCSSLPRRS